MNNLILHSKPLYEEDDYQRLNACLDCFYTASGGQNSEELREVLIQYYATREVELTSSGATAMLLALIIIGLKPNDNVLLPTYLCKEVFESVKFLNLNPILVDIDVSSFTLSFAKVEKALLKNKIDAIIFPHLFGISGDIKSLKKLEIPIIEDISQGLGATIDSQPVGSFGDVSIMSFKSIKMLGGSEGGAVLINNKKHLYNFRQYEMGGNMYYSLFKFPMSELAASLSLSQFLKLSKFLSRRTEISNIYNNEFLHLKNADIIKSKNNDGNYRYLLKLRNISIEHVKVRFEEEGILIRRPVDALLHQIYNIPGEFFNAENIFDKLISIPIYPALKDNEIKRIISITKAILN